MNDTQKALRRIRDLVPAGAAVIGDDSVAVTGVKYDSRDVEQGALFVAMQGERANGHAFIRQALQRGAVAVMHNRDAPEVIDLRPEFPRVVWIGVDDSRTALASVAARFFGYPADELTLVGITGTNGKTTTSYILKAMLEAWKQKAGLIGTIKYKVGDRSYDAPHTTPEAADFHGLLRMMADAGCGYVVAEVSSHALAQHRVHGTPFRAAVFTNLTRDHLDFHETMERYFAAKKLLFTELLVAGGVAAINIDDEYGRKLADELRGRVSEGRNITIITFGMQSVDADVKPQQVASDFNRTHGIIRATTDAGTRTFEFTSPLVGTTNVMNMLAAASVAIGLGIPDKAISAGISSLEAVQGRFERITAGQRYLAVIDYAHTEDALERLLLNARTLLDQSVHKGAKRSRKRSDELFLPQGNGEGRVITVFGCGGNRDRGKRSHMGEVASRLSYFVILTNDNPRFEDAKEIIHEIERGIRGDNYIVIHDRRAAIAMAVELASPGDIIVVAGKGHEEYQEILGVKHHFSDREVLEGAIRYSMARHARRGGRSRTAVRRC